jgi:hypothetical protein
MSRTIELKRLNKPMPARKGFYFVLFHYSASCDCNVHLDVVAWLPSSGVEPARGKQDR